MGNQGRQRRIGAGADLGRAFPQRAHHAHGLLQARKDGLAPPQVAAHGHVAQAGQALGAGFGVVAQPEYFREHQHAGALAGVCGVEGQVPLHGKPVRLILHRLYLHRILDPLTNCGWSGRRRLLARPGSAQDTTCRPC